jgi:hypothetical protein
MQYLLDPRTGGVVLCLLHEVQKHSNLQNVNYGKQSKFGRYVFLVQNSPLDLGELTTESLRLRKPTLGMDLSLENSEYRPKRKRTRAVSPGALTVKPILIEHKTLLNVYTSQSNSALSHKLQLLDLSRQQQSIHDLHHSISMGHVSLGGAGGSGALFCSIFHSVTLSVSFETIVLSPGVQIHSPTHLKNNGTEKWTAVTLNSRFDTFALVMVEVQRKLLMCLRH